MYGYTCFCERNTYVNVKYVTFELASNPQNGPASGFSCMRSFYPNQQILTRKYSKQAKVTYILIGNPKVEEFIVKYGTDQQSDCMGILNLIG